MVRPLHAWLKNVFRNLLLWCIFKTVKVMDQSEASIYWNKTNQLVGLILDEFYSFFKSQLVQLQICGHMK